jgi:hypothetical protein
VCSSDLSSGAKGMGVLMNNLSDYYGLKIFQSALIVKRVQFRRPRSRKRRIQRKWAARPENFRESPAAYIVNGNLYCHSTIAAKLKAVSSKT